MKISNKIITMLVMVVVLLLTAQVVFAAVASNDTATTAEDTLVSVTVLTNDTHDGSPTITAASTPSNGVAVINGNNVDYTPNQDFFGTDSFTYTVNDTGGPSTATVSMTVTAVNDAPVANDDTASAFSEVEVSVAVLGNDNDVDTGDTLTLQSVTTPANGAAVINGNNVDYTANANFEGTDTFDYTVSDGTTTSTATVTVTVDPVFNIERVEINGKTNGDFSLDDTNEIQVKVQNDFTEDLEEIVVTVTILDVDGDDLEEESDEFDLDTGDDDEVDLEFDLEDEDLDEDDYTVEIMVEGEDSSGNNYVTIETQTVDVDRERHQVVIRRANLQASTLQCSDPYTSVSVTIENIGKSNEDDVEVRVVNNALNIDLSKSNIDLDKFSGRDNDYKSNFALDLSDAEAGRYTFNVEVFRDGTLEDREDVSVTVQGCDSRTGSNSGEEVDNLQRQLQEGLQDRSNQQKTVVESGLRESKTYTLLLGFLVMLTFVSIVLALAVLTVKR